MPKTVTMKTVAQLSKVTEATVSMSLANNPRIPRKTRERIQAIADKLGYRTHPYVSALLRMRRQGRAQAERPILAMVNAFRRADGWRNAQGPTVRQMRDGVMERAALRGYQAQEFWLHQDGMSPERFSEVLRTRSIHGVVISPLAEGAPPPKLKWDYFAAVSLSVPLPALTIPTICNDHFSSSLLAARECYALGYRRMGLVIREMHRERFDARWEGGMHAAKLLMPRITQTRTLLMRDWDDEAALSAWIKKEQPEAIISPGAEWFPPVLQKMGLNAPADIGLAGLSCSQMGHECSGVFQNGNLIGATAVDTLISMVERFEHGLPAQATTIMIESTWNPGKTLRTITTPLAD